MTLNELSLRMQIVEMVTAEALARAFADADDMRRWTEDMDAEVSRVEARRDITGQSLRAAWDRMLALVRRQFAQRDALPPPRI